MDFFWDVYILNNDWEVGSCDCVQSQVGCGFKQPDLVKDVPAHGRGVD